MNTRLFFVLLLTLLLFTSDFLLSPVSAGRSYYEILGIRKDANEKTMKKAYRKLSMKYHPDKNQNDPEAQKKFVEVSTAYETLSDPQKRRIYDTQGEEGLKQHGQGGGRDPTDIFSQFFGGGFGGHQQQQAEQRGDDVLMDLPVSLADLYKGRVLEVLVQSQQLCPHCRGSGAHSDHDIHTCRVCGGKGYQIRMQSLGPGFMQQVQMPCDACGGKGKTISKSCHVCSGKKLVSGKKTLDVYIEAGMKDGEKVEFEHAGEESPDVAAGHIIFRIVQLADQKFERKGNDLYYTMNISLLESLTGFQREILHLDNHPVPIGSNKEIIPHGHQMKIKGEGMPIHNSASQKGDLYVRFIVDFPKSLTQQQQEGFIQILK